jgi:DNA adenine methylase
VTAVTVAAGQQQHAGDQSLLPVADMARKINHTPGLVTHPLAAGRYQSPLRYPGAKSSLSRVIGDLIAAGRRSPQVGCVDLLVEPFAGGASTSLRLVGSGQVERVLLADADPMVAAFWQVAASRTQELIDRISEEHASYVAVGGSHALDRWDYWRAWAPESGSNRATRDRELAIKCLFLNRTTFSGILHGRAGPIGGRTQTSEYGIGCRFNLDALVQRLEYVGHLYDTGRLVDVWRADWQSTLHGVASHYKTLLPDRVVAYLDPPYLSKSWKLYRRSFEHDATGASDSWTGPQHLRLAKYLYEQMQYRWILSYDQDERLLTDRSLYAGDKMRPTAEARRLNGVHSWHVSKRLVTLNYTASARAGRRAEAELLITTLPPSTVPDTDKLMAFD